jgi:hypothetical protein
MYCAPSVLPLLQTLNLTVSRDWSDTTLSSLEQLTSLQSLTLSGPEGLAIVGPGLRELPTSLTELNLLDSTLNVTGAFLPSLAFISTLDLISFDVGIPSQIKRVVSWDVLSRVKRAPSLRRSGSHR